MVGKGMKGEVGVGAGEGGGEVGLDQGRAVCGKKPLPISEINKEIKWKPYIYCQL